MTDFEASGSELNELLMSMDGRTGLLAGDRVWEPVREWTSFSARFILLQSGPDRIALKLGTNWESDSVAYVAGEIDRVSRFLASLSSGRVAMPGVLGMAANPPALALEYFEGTPLFEAIPVLGEAERQAVLRACGEAIGAFHRSEHVPDEPFAGSAAMAELSAAARRALVSRAAAARIGPGLARARSYRFSPNDFLVTDQQTLVLLDPPHVQKYDFVHRDIGSFFMELHRSLVGEWRPDATEADSVERSRNAFLDGYREAGPDDLIRPEDIWAIDLFQAARVAGVARSRLSSRALGPGCRALSWAWWIRRGLSLEREG
ncbi:MAG: phosphotransferase [Acidimicrobiia bacterium]